MALKLNKKTAGVFKGKVGDRILLGASVAKVAGDTPVRILAITYNQITTKKPPFEFTVAAGDHGLVVVSVSTPGTQVSIDEVDTADPTNRQSLVKQTFDLADPAAVVLIQA